MLKTIALTLLSAWSMMTFASTDTRTEPLDDISAKLALAEAGGNPHDVSPQAKDRGETDGNDERHYGRATAHHADKKREIAGIEDDTQEIQCDQSDAVNDAQRRHGEEYQR